MLPDSAYSERPGVLNSSGDGGGAPGNSLDSFSDTLVECRCSDSSEIICFQVHSCLLAVCSRVFAAALARVKRHSALKWNFHLPSCLSTNCDANKDVLELVSDDALVVTCELSCIYNKVDFILDGLKLEVAKSLFNIFYGEDWEIDERSIPQLVSLLHNLKCYGMDGIEGMISAGLARGRQKRTTSVQCVSMGLPTERNEGLKFLAELFLKSEHEEAVQSSIDEYADASLFFFHLPDVVNAPRSFSYLTFCNLATILMKSSSFEKESIKVRLVGNSTDSMTLHRIRDILLYSFERITLKPRITGDSFEIVINFSKLNFFLIFTFDSNLLSVDVTECDERTSYILKNVALLFAGLAVPINMSKYEITKLWKATDTYHLKGKVPNDLCIDKPASATQLYEVKYDWTTSSAKTVAYDTPKLVKKELPHNFGIQMSPLLRPKIKTEHNTEAKAILNESYTANIVSSGIDGSRVHWKKRSLSLFGVFKQPPNDANNNRAALKTESSPYDAVASCQGIMDQSFQDTTFVKHEISEVSEKRHDLWMENSQEMDDTVTGCRSIDSPKKRKATIQRSKNLADIDRAEKEQADSGEDCPRRCPACSLSFPSLLKVISHIQKNHLYGVTKVTGSRCVDSLCPVSVRVFNEVPHTLKHLVKSVNRCRYCSFSCKTVGGLTRHTTIHEVSGKRLKEESDSDQEVVIKKEKEEETEDKKRYRKCGTPEKIEDIGETAYRQIVKPRISISRKPKPKNIPREHLGIRLQKYLPCSFRENSSSDMDSFKMPSKCYVCGLVFKSGDSAATRALHYHSLHRKLLPLRCPFPECPLILRQSALLLEHIRYHMAMQRFSCGLCTFSAPSLKTIKLHARAHQHKRSDSPSSSSGDLSAGDYKQPPDNPSTSRRRARKQQHMLKCSPESAPPLAPRKFVKNPPRALDTNLFSAIWGIEDTSIDPLKVKEEKRKRKDSSDSSRQKKPRLENMVESSEMFGVLSNMKGVTIKVAGSAEVDRTAPVVPVKPKERGMDEILSKLPVTVTIKTARECDLGTDKGEVADETGNVKIAPISKLLNPQNYQKLEQSGKDFYRNEVKKSENEVTDKLVRTVKENLKNEVTRKVSENEVTGKVSENDSVDSISADESMDVDEDYVPNEELDTSDEYDMKRSKRSSKRKRKSNWSKVSVGSDRAGPSCDSGKGPDSRKRPVPSLTFSHECKSDEHLFKKPSVSSIKQIRKQTKQQKKDECYQVTLETAKRRLDFDIGDLTYNSFEAGLSETLKAKSGVCSEIRDAVNQENDKQIVGSTSSKSEDTIKKSEDTIKKSEDTIKKSEDTIKKSEDTIIKSQDTIIKSQDAVRKTREILKNYSFGAKKTESQKFKTQLKKLSKGGSKFMKEILQKDDGNEKQRKNDAPQSEGNYKPVAEGKQNGVARLRSDPSISTFMKKLEALDTKPKKQKTRKCDSSKKPSAVDVRTPPLARRTLSRTPPPTPDSSCGEASSINSKAVRDAFNAFMSQSKNEGKFLERDDSKQEMFSKFMSVCLGADE